MIEVIYQKILELFAEGSKEEDLIIAFPAIYESVLIEEFFEGYFMPPPTILSDKYTIFGVNTYNQHPYNEIVIYDSKNIYKGERFRREIEFKQQPAIIHSQS